MPVSYTKPREGERWTRYTRHCIFCLQCLTHFSDAFRYVTYFSSYVACQRSTDTPVNTFLCHSSPPILLKEREHSFFTLAPNQVCIELTAICQSFPALRLQICNLFWCLLGIFNSNINTGIVSCKYIKCHRRPDSRYRLQPPSPDRHTGFEKSDTHMCVFLS